MLILKKYIAQRLELQKKTSLSTASDQQLCLLADRTNYAVSPNVFLEIYLDVSCLY